MPRIRAKHLLIVAVLLLAAIFVPPMISMGRFRRQIQNSLSNGLGRPVTIGDTTLRLFPQPGFDLKNVIIAEDPAFGIEPMIRADEVTAALRLSSLWRGHLEIAKLSLVYPSLNLVRNAQGQWNIEALIARTTQVAAAPTTKAHAEARPRFPYIESDTGRVNFKFGVEKKVFSLTDADFAFWQDSENEWRVRLKARPVRTDLSLSDTGRLNLDGAFQRARVLRDTPMRVRLQWQDAQLGQFTSLIYGRDRGWRGGLQLSTVLSGTPGNLNVTADARVDDFRRYDIFTAENFRIDAHCAGKFSTDHGGTFNDVNCSLPTQGNGLVRISGDYGPQSDAIDLSLSAADLPASTVVAFARHTKRDIPDDLAATGLLHAAFTYRRSGPQLPGVWDGGGETSGVVLRSSTLEQPLTLGTLRFAFTRPAPAVQRRDRHHRERQSRAPQPAPEPRLVVAPFAVTLGSAAPLTASAWFSGSGYSLGVEGDSEIARLVQLGRTIGLRIPQAKVEGHAHVDLAVVGDWNGFNSPKPMGFAQLRDVRTELTGASAPLQIASADLRLDQDEVALENIAASFAGVPMNITGMVALPRQCEAVERCPALFDLRADELNAERLNALLNPRAVSQPWYRILTGTRRETPLLARITAYGRLTAAKVVLGDLVTTKVTAQAELAQAILDLREVDSTIYGGHHRSSWRLDFSGDNGKYGGTGEIANVSLAQAAAAMHDKWITGTANLRYQVDVAGYTGAALSSSAKGSVVFDCRNGELRRVLLGGANGTTRFMRFSGEAALRNGVFSIASSKLQTRSGVIEVGGTATLGQQLDLSIRDHDRTFSVRGSLDAPKVVPASAQMSLKQ